MLERRTSDEEKARVNVTTNISNGLKAINAEMPILYKHLKDRIITAKKCSYKIDSSEQLWRIEWNK